MQDDGVKHTKINWWYKITGTALGIELGYMLDVLEINVPFSVRAANISLLNGVHNSHIYCIVGLSLG